MQVIKETNENGADDRVSNSSPDDDVSPTEDLVQNDSFTLTIEDATSKGFLELAAANWSIALRSHREAEQEVKKVVAVCEFGQLQKQAAYNEIINNLSMGEDAIREASNKRSKYGRVCLNRKYK